MGYFLWDTFYGILFMGYFLWDTFYGIYLGILFKIERKQITKQNVTFGDVMMV
jgi:hypothetical protein